MQASFELKISPPFVILEKSFKYIKMKNRHVRATSAERRAKFLVINVVRTFAVLEWDGRVSQKLQELWVSIGHVHNKWRLIRLAGGSGAE